MLSGGRGSLAAPTMRLRAHEGEASWWLPLATHRLAVPAHDPLVAQLAHFCDVIRCRAAPRVSVRDATRTLSVTLAISAAAASGKSVTPE